jgi:hypothetical protein
MGDAAELMLDGTLDDMGEYIDGKSPGYPRPRSGGLWEKRKQTPKVSNIQRIRELVISLKIYKKWHTVAYDYRITLPNVRHLDPKSLQRLAKTTCNDFSKFEEYCKSLINKTDEPKN